jgi:hypothetical protein
MPLVPTQAISQREMSRPVRTGLAVQADTTRRTELELRPAAVTGDSAMREPDKTGQQCKAGRRCRINQRCKIAPWHRTVPAVAEERLAVATAEEPTGRQAAAAAPAWEFPHLRGVAAVVVAAAADVVARF